MLGETVPEEGASRPGPMAIGFAIDPALTLLERAGIEARPLLVRAGLSKEHTGDYSLRRVPSAAQARFLEYAAEALETAPWGFTSQQGGPAHGRARLLYRSRRKTLGEAMELMTRYVSIADECARLKLAPQPDGVALEYKFVGLSRHLLRQQSEFALAMAINAIRFASGREIQPVRVRFAHVRRSDLKDFVRFFGCPVEFNAPSDHLAFSRETLALPLVTADPQLLLTLRPICEAEAGALNKRAGFLRASVESEVQRLLPQGHANIKTVAKALGLSARTLSRYLAAEGSAFTEIVDELRHTLALQYLKEPNLPLAQIAWLLGYGTATSFTHAFRRWAGRPPSAVRSERCSRSERTYGRSGANGATG